MEVENNVEPIFLYGFDASVNTEDIKQFFKTKIQNDFQVKLHSYRILEKVKIIAEVTMTASDAAFTHQQIQNFRIKNNTVKIIPKNSMKSIIISNIPSVISEKDLFLMTARITPGLKRITIADDTEFIGKTQQVCVATYHEYEQAKQALQALEFSTILSNSVQASWKIPTHDVIGDFAQESRAIYIKNVSYNTQVNQLRQILSEFGKVQRIKKFATKAFVEFDSIKAAKKAQEKCSEMRVDGAVWKVQPAKKLDLDRLNEEADRNLTFSKNFLNEEDQQLLLKYVWDQQAPDIVKNAQQFAQNIVDQAQKVQFSQLEMLKMQLENLKNLQGLNNNNNRNRMMGMGMGMNNNNNEDEEESEDDDGTGSQMGGNGNSMGQFNMGMNNANNMQNNMNNNNGGFGGMMNNNSMNGMSMGNFGLQTQNTQQTNMTNMTQS